MLQFRMDPSLSDCRIPFGCVEVYYPEKLDTASFRMLVDMELSSLQKEYSTYERKAVFGENPYFRYFRKFKKTYPVMMQFESILLKGRSFPEFNSVAEVAFLMEIITHVLSGTHDVECLQGAVTLYCADCKEEFPGLRGVPFHTYPGDFCGRDEENIIFSLIAGADDRTCARPDSRHVFYPIFGVPGLSVDVIKNAIDTLVRFIRVLSPDALIETTIL